MWRVRCILLAALATTTGCAHWNAPTPGGRFITDYKPGKDAELSHTPYQATYVLQHCPDPPSDPPPREWIPEQQVVTLYVRGLGKWQSIGFEKTADGELLAVAGEEKIKLEPGRYRWHMDPNTEYTGFKWLAHESGQRTVEILTLPFSIAAAVIVLTCIGVFFLVAWPFFLL